MRDVLELIEAKDMTAAEIAEAMAAFPRCPAFDRCSALSGRGFLCSMTPGHDGNVHAAYGGEDELCALWPDAEAGA